MFMKQTNSFKNENTDNRSYSDIDITLQPDFIARRISELRLQSNMSEYQLSTELGHCKSYIQSISSGRSLPSMSEFMYICEFFKITPKEFFTVDEPPSLQISKLLYYAKLLTPECLLTLVSVAEFFSIYSSKS